MNRLLIAAVLPLALSLPGCTGALLPANVPESPAAVADKTILDERAAIAIELAYRAQTKLLETGVDAGLLTGARAARAASFDRRAYSAVKTVRAAYDTGNAQSYAAALDNARGAIAAALDTITGEQT